MQPIPVQALETRTPIEIGILFGICNRTLAKAPAFGQEWRAAHGTIQNILQLRRSRIAAYRPWG